MHPKNRSILIVGMAKTGTTGVFNTTKAAIQAEGYPHLFLHEPTTPVPFRAIGRYAPEQPIMTKIMLHRLRECRIRYPDFDRLVCTVRDPRDMVVSRLLFRPLIRRSAKTPPEAVDQFVQALKEKEADPTSHSVRDLHAMLDDLGMGRSGWERAVSYLKRKDDLVDKRSFFTLKYEDFVDNKLDPLRDYLDMPVNNPGAGDSGWLGHIPRSMTHGEWRRWFTDEDAEFFSTLFAEYMDRHGYDRGARPDMTLGVDASTGSEYVIKKFSERARDYDTTVKGLATDKSAKKWRATEVQSTQDLDRMRAMAEDGHAETAYRAGMVVVSGHVIDKDPQLARELLHHAAVRGHIGAMRQLSKTLTEDFADDDSAILQARFWKREADTVPTEGDTSALKRKLRAVRRSPEHRVGKAMVAFAKDPVHGAKPASKELRKAWRKRAK